MNNTLLIVTIFILALGVWLTRFLPFLVFKNTSKLPKLIEYLGKVLPPAMMGLLVVYCVKDCNFLNLSELLPLLLSVSVVVVLHLTKKNSILSISAGTVVYMILIRLI